MRSLQMYSKVALACYVVALLLRVTFYFVVINLVNQEEENKQNLYSSFYAAFMEDEIGAIIITSLVLVCFSLCFGFTICLIFAANKQVDMLR
jgi:hypothetical protein